MSEWDDDLREHFHTLRPGALETEAALAAVRVAGRRRVRRQRGGIVVAGFIGIVALAAGVLMVGREGPIEVSASGGDAPSSGLESSSALNPAAASGTVEFGRFVLPNDYESFHLDPSATADPRECPMGIANSTRVVSAPVFVHSDDPVGDRIALLATNSQVSSDPSTSGRSEPGELLGNPVIVHRVADDVSVGLWFRFGEYDVYFACAQRNAQASFDEFVGKFIDLG